MQLGLCPVLLSLMPLAICLHLCPGYDHIFLGLCYSQRSGGWEVRFASLLLDL